MWCLVRTDQVDPSVTLLTVSKITDSCIAITSEEAFSEMTQAAQVPANVCGTTCPSLL